MGDKITSHKSWCLGLVSRGAMYLAVVEADSSSFEIDIFDIQHSVTPANSFQRIFFDFTAGSELTPISLMCGFPLVGVFQKHYTYTAMLSCV